MQELVRLRQQQQSTDNQLQTVGQRVHVMEQRQQQMMSFLAKAMQSPGFMSQLVHQQNDSNRQISGGNKKRRLPNQDEENISRKYSITSPDAQIIQYKPLMNEAAKSMLRQILNMNTSSRSDSKLSNASGFLIDQLHPPSDVLDTGSSSNRMSGLTLSEVLPNSAAISEIQSSSGLAEHGNSHDTLFPEVNSGLTDFVLPHGIAPENNIDLCDGTFKGAESIGLDEPMRDYDIDILLDDIQKLPSINDVFWEQFLSSTDDNTDKINGSGEDEQKEQESEWDKLKNLNSLTEHMGLLASASESG
ncbi:hypothetical protein ABFX02_06G009200 [Erythranthe guttata]